MSPSSTSSSEASRGSDERVWAEELPGPRALRRFASVLAVATFAAGTFGLGAWDALRPVPPPLLDGQEAVRRDQQRLRADWRNGTLTALWTQDADERSNLRELALPYYVAFLVRTFREAGSSILVGRDEWMYLKNRAVTSTEWTDEAIGRYGAALFRVIASGLARQGCRAWVYVLPRKAVMTRAHLPESVDPRPGIDVALVREMTRMRVDIVDLAETFAGTPPDDLWYRQDTHWTPLGQWLAAQAVCSAAGILAPEDDWRGTIDRTAMQRQRQHLLDTAGVHMDELFFKKMFPSDRCLALDPVLLGKAQRRRKGAPTVGVVGTSFTEGESFLADVQLIAKANIEAGARLGFGWASNLKRYLDKRGEPPQILLQEFPVYPLLRDFDRRNIVEPEEELARLLAELTSVGPHATLFPPQVVRHAIREGKGSRGRAAHLVPSGLLATSGDGSVGLRLRRTGKAVRSEAELTMVDTRLTVPWLVKDEELVLPLVMAGPGAPPFRVLGEPQLRWEVEPVTWFDLEHATVAALGEPRSEPGEDNKQVRDALFPQPLDPAADAAILVRLVPSGPARGRLQLHLLVDAGTDRPAVELLLPWTVMSREGVALLSVPAGSSGPVTGVRVTTLQLTPSAVSVVYSPE